VNGGKYLITDENAALYSTRWKKYRREFIVKTFLGNKDFGRQTLMNCRALQKK
jgi:hypothetical protein